MNDYILLNKNGEAINVSSDPREYQVTGTFQVVRYPISTSDQDQLQTLTYDKAIEQYDRRRLVNDLKAELETAKARLKAAERQLLDTSLDLEKYGEWLSTGHIQEQLSVDEYTDLKRKFYIIKTQEVSGFRLDGGAIAEIEYTEPGQPTKWVQVIDLAENLFNQPDDYDGLEDDSEDEISEIVLRDEVKEILPNDRIMYLDWLIGLTSPQFQENVNVEDWVVQNLLPDDQLFVLIANRFNSKDTLILPEAYISEDAHYYNNSVSEIVLYINKSHDFNIQPEHYEEEVPVEQVEGPTL